MLHQGIATALSLCTLPTAQEQCITNGPGVSPQEAGQIATGVECVQWTCIQSNVVRSVCMCGEHWGKEGLRVWRALL